MTHIYNLEIEALIKINNLRKLISLFKADVGARVLQKEKQMPFGIYKDLKDQCDGLLQAVKYKKFQCKFCQKAFDDGRKLGGHTSRVHKSEFKFRNMELEQKRYEGEEYDDAKQRSVQNELKNKKVKQQVKMEEEN